MIYYCDNHYSSDFNLLKEKFPKGNIWIFPEEIIYDDYFKWNPSKIPYEGWFKDIDNIHVYKQGELITSFPCNKWEEYTDIYKYPDIITL